MWVPCGTGVVLIQRLPDGRLPKLHLDCPSEDAGWIVTYDGALPHAGSISGASPGSKILMQVIGAATGS